MGDYDYGEPDHPEDIPGEDPIEEPEEEEKIDPRGTARNMYRLVDATYRPKDSSTLKPQFSKLVGFRGKFRSFWIADAGPYRGRMCYVPEQGIDQPFPRAWIPDCDLEIHEVLEPGIPPAAKVA